MFRVVIVCLSMAGATVGCVSLPPSSARNYCLTSGGGACAELEGHGDCQPCPGALLGAAPDDGHSLR
jgi:hypothetical protein